MKFSKFTLEFEYLIYFLIPFASGTIYLFAFFPGILSFDSFYQWQQLSEGQFTNWHPAYHTIIMWLLTRFWYSPAVVAFVQIIIFSIVVAYCLGEFRSMGVPKTLLIGIALLGSVNLINGVMVITLWKDILYSISVLLLTVIILKVINSNSIWLNKNVNICIISITAANIILLRHNGFPVVVISYLALLLIYRDNWKRILLSGVYVIVYVLMIKGPVYIAFDVERNYSQKAAVTLVHPIAAHLQTAPPLSETDYQFLDSIFPLDKPWPYSCYDATVLFYKGVHFNPVNENQIETVKLLLKFTVSDFRTTFNHFICVSSFTWEITQPENVYLETILLSNFDASSVEQWKPYVTVTSQRPVLMPLRELLIKTYTFLTNFDGWQIFWRPAIYMYLFLISVFVLAISNQKKNWLLLTVPLLSQTLVIMFTAQLQALRYQYPVYLISMFFTIPITYLGIREWKNHKK